MFRGQLWGNMEAYIDNIVVKGKAVGNHLSDLTETFEVLRQHHMKLNASRCAFRVSLGKLLGYLVTHRSTEVNSDQIVALQNLKPPRSPNEVQHLIKMIAALNRFIAQSADKCRLSFQLLKKWKYFQWTEECQRAFSELKMYLARSPILNERYQGIFNGLNEGYQG